MSTPISEHEPNLEQGPNLEHVNVTVTDPARTAELMNQIFGWKTRWHGPSLQGGYTYHVGTDDSYLALYTPSDPKDVDRNSKQTGNLNHVGVVVADLEAVEAQVKAAGFTPFNHANYKPGRRFYFHDNDNIEFEIVSYS
ncbi:MAG: VOC family protein [Alphaproteobacteria bacterium]|nr:MAG: VOC family protein [Alphaproteobacteria bacterium]